jgi:hypothetical protein
MILVRFLDLKFLHGLAASLAGTSKSTALGRRRRPIAVRRQGDAQRDGFAVAASFKNPGRL